MKENALESASLGTIMGCGFRYVLAEFIFPVLAISGPVGWSIEIGVVGLTVLYSLRNFIGFWKRCNCFDDVLELFYNLTIKNLSKIIESSLKKYDLVITRLKDILSNSKEIISEIKNFKNILGSYEFNRIMIVDEKFEEVFKLAFNEFEENDELKKAFKKIIEKIKKTIWLIHLYKIIIKNYVLFLF